MFGKRRLLPCAAVLCLLFLAACAGPAPTNTPPPPLTPTQALIPAQFTVTPSPIPPTPTLTFTPTATITDTALPTSAFTPTPPSTPVPTATPAPTETFTPAPTIILSPTIPPTDTAVPVPVALAVDFPVSAEPQDIALAGGSLCVAHADGTVQVLTLEGALLTTVQVDGGVTALATNGARIWVLHRGGMITQIDAATRAITARWNIGCANCLARGLHWDGSALWASNFGENSLHRVDPATGNVQRFSAGAEGPTVIMSDGRGLIVLHQTLAGQGVILTRHDTSGTLTGSINTAGFPTAALSDGESLWLSLRVEETGFLVRYDAATLQETWRVEAAPINDLLLVSGSLWSADFAEDTVTQRDPATGAVLDLYPAGDLPQALVYQDGFLWVVNRRAGTLTRLWIGP